VAALEESLRSGVVRLDAADLVDSTTILTLARSGMALDRDALLREIAALRGAGGGEEQGTGDDPVPGIVADLRAEDPEAVRRGLRHAEVAGPAVVGHLIPLLGRNAVFLDALRVLRRLAPRATGQLLDALLDPEQEAAVRRRIARVLRSASNPRAVSGLLQALDDPAFDVRRECGLTLLRLTERDVSLAVPRDAVFAAAVRELREGAPSWGAEPEARGEESSPGARAHTPRERGLAHVFTLLSLVMEREPLQIALLAVVGPDSTLRGTALEYLETVLPDDVRRALWPHVGARAAASPLPSRPPDQVVEDLMRSRETAAARTLKRRD
jgi:hypothetical protein